jgi:DNA polymerase sigma
MDDEDFVQFTHAAGSNSSRPHPMLVTQCRVPWMQEHVDAAVSPLARLHNEILSFCEYCAPTAHELQERTLALEQVSAVIKEVYPDAVIKVFGSQMTKILTPSSDLDIVSN